MRGSARKLAALLVSATLAVALSGCLVISFQSGNQIVSMGPVTLTITACADGSPSCPGTANATDSPSWYEFTEGVEPADVQALLAVRLPEGAEPPANLTAAVTGGGMLAFSRSASYEAELEALEPAPAGQRWWGWISSAFSYSHAQKQGFSVTFAVNLPRPADGGPHPSPFQWRPVTGGRISDGSSHPAGRAVKCGEENSDLYAGYNEVGAANSTVCIDFPAPEAARGFVTAPIIDFGILGSTVEASPGTTLTAAFLAKRSGLADPATKFALAATTGVPGGTVSLDKSTISLSGDATQPVVATIGVPAGTPPGSYPVTLSATSSGKPQRSATVTVTVPGKPGSVDEAPAIRKASLTRKRFRTKVKRNKAGRKVGPPLGTKLRLNLSEASRLSIEVAKLGRRGRALGTSVRPLPAGASTIAIAKRIGAVRLKPGRYRITVFAEDAAGQRSTPVQLAFTVVGG